MPLFMQMPLPSPPQRGVENELLPFLQPPTPPPYSLSPQGRKGASQVALFSVQSHPLGPRVNVFWGNPKCFLNDILGRNALTRFGCNEISSSRSHKSPVNGQRLPATPAPTTLSRPGLPSCLADFPEVTHCPREKRMHIC